MLSRILNEKKRAKNKNRQVVQTLTSLQGQDCKSFTFCCFVCYAAFSPLRSYLSFSGKLTIYYFWKKIEQVLDQFCDISAFIFTSQCISEHTATIYALLNLRSYIVLK